MTQRAELNAEERRLGEDARREKNWKRWGESFRCWPSRS